LVQVNKLQFFTLKQVEAYMSTFSIQYHFVYQSCIFKKWHTK